MEANTSNFSSLVNGHRLSPLQITLFAVCFLVAALDVPAAHATLLVRIKPGRLHLTGALPVPDRRDAQAWVIDASGTPRSLGVLRRAGDQGLETVPQRALAPGQTLAISIEPLGGAPGPLPTGPVVATGKIETI